MNSYIKKFFHSMAVLSLIVVMSFVQAPLTFAYSTTGVGAMGAPDRSASSLFSSRITVYNRSSRTIYVKVSKACGAGQDGYWRIPSGGSESWSRCIFARVKITGSSTPSNTYIFASIYHVVKIATACNSISVWGTSFQYNNTDRC